MQYRSIEDMNKDIRLWLPRLPDDIDLLVGVPRSGLLAATILSLNMNVPVTDVNGLIEGRILPAGPRYGARTTDFLKTPRKVMVLDDCVFTGKAIEEARSKIEAAKLPHDISYAAVYIEPQNSAKIDYHCKPLSWPHVFEWNIMHHWMLKNSCVDIDGVLCRDPSPEEDDDGPLYQEFLRNAQPFLRVSGTIGWLVTCRLEKYRKQTEQWLAKHGIEYDHLVMLDLPDLNARLRARCDASFKADVYKTTGAALFIESSRYLAASIANLAGRDVYCAGSSEMYYPGTMSRIRVSNARVFFRKAFTNPRSALARLMRTGAHALHRAKLFALSRFSTRTG